MFSKTNNNKRLERWLEWMPFETADATRQLVLERALEWASLLDTSVEVDADRRVNLYMDEHQESDDVSEVVSHMNTVIDWAEKSLFPSGGSSRSGLSNQDWHRLSESASIRDR